MGRLPKFTWYKKTVEMDQLLLLGILILALFLRFYKVSEIPLTHDEFSALFRTEYQSFSNLIEHGVKPDGHPAGIQVFLYLMNEVLGLQGTILKIPFLIFGILALVYSYKIARDWFNPTVGLLAVSFMSGIQYMIYYSQIARPYASGLFFSLLMVWNWSNFLFHPEKNRMKSLAGMVIAGILCWYNHYFSMLFAGMVWITGLFLVNKKILRRYIVGGILIGVAFIPHLPIFFHQLKIKGVEEWLAKPGISFLTDYFSYVFHFSPVLVFIILVITGLGFLPVLRNRKSGQCVLFRKIALIWFFVPLIVGFFYSTIINAVLQYSVLIFAFPMLVIFLFSFYRDIHPGLKIVGVLLIVTAGSSTLIFQRKHYDLFYNSGPKTILGETIFQKTAYGEKNVTVFYHADPRVIGYYSGRELDPGKVKFMNEFFTYSDFRDHISELKTELLIYAWTAPLPYEFAQIIKERYPYHVLAKQYFLSEFHLFSRKPQPDRFTSEIWEFESGFETGLKIPGFRANRFIDTLSSSGKQSYLLNRFTSFSPAVSIPLDSFNLSGNEFITTSLDVYHMDAGSRSVLVGSLESEGKQIVWQGNDTGEFITTFDNWGKTHLSIRIPKKILRHKNLVFKTYLWNRDSANLYMDNLRIQIHNGNPVLYGLFEKI